MKRKSLFFGLCGSFLIFLLCGDGHVVHANSIDNGGAIEFEGEYPKDIYDPENPGQAVNPGDSPRTDGNLRIDFVPQFRFGTNQVSSDDSSYLAFAQLFKDSTPARGNFVQVSDYRNSDSGWQLSVRQEAQFQNENGSTLDGAIISLDNSWTNSIQNAAKSPVVKKDVINMTVGESQILATANKGTGEGSWSISFGASATNTNDQKDTLKPLMDKDNNPVTDPSFEDKPIYLNSAVKLLVPGKAKKEPGTTYKTVITWTLSELP